jgi:hypothetical protein
MWMLVAAAISGAASENVTATGTSESHALVY